MNYNTRLMALWPKVFLMLSVLLFTMKTSLAFPAIELNDICSDAIAINCGQEIIGNRNELTNDTIFYSAHYSKIVKAIWYTFQASGEVMELNITLTPNSYYSNSLNLFKNECESLIFIDEDYQRIRFKPEIGVTYFVAVAREIQDTSQLEYNLNLLCSNESVVNETCAKALIISTLETTQGSLANATIDIPAIQNCSHSVAPDIFYKFAGNDSLISIYLTSQEVQNPRIRLYTGKCDSLVCAETSTSSDVPIFYASTNDTFTMRISGIASLDSGAITLDFNSVENNQSCSTAVPIELPSRIYKVSENGALRYMDCTSDTISNDNWWKFSGNDNVVTIQFPGQHENKFALYAGSCDSLYCINATRSYSAFYFSHNQYFDSFLASQGVSYYLRSQPTGSSNFYIEESPLLPNNSCDGAIPIETSDSLFYNTQYAIKDTANCSNNDVATIWFKTTGNGQTAIIEDISVYPYQSGVLFSVYEGACGELECISSGRNDNEVYWNTKDGKEYYISLSSFSHNRGLLSLTFKPTQVNDECPNAMPILSGSTYYSDLDYSSHHMSCNGYSNNNGNWYSFTGNDSIVDISMLEGHPSGFFDVFLGPCDSLTCFEPIIKESRSARFFAELDEAYIVSMQKRNNFSYNSTYAFMVSSVNPLANNYCRTAAPLSCTDSIFLDFHLSSASLSLCSNYNKYENNIWYDILGDGSLYEFQSSNQYQPKIVVTQGNCAESICIGPYNGKYLLEPGINYKIQFSQSYYTDTTSVRVICHEPPPNNLCSNALVINEGLNIGSTSGASPSSSNLPCYYPNFPSTWYQLIGDGMVYSFILDSTSAMPYGYLDTYKGSCDSLICAGRNYINQQDTIYFLAESGIHYYFEIHSSIFSVNGGDFAFQVNSKTPLYTNDGCLGAIDYNCGENIAGSFNGASPNPALDCYIPWNRPGRWYTLIGDGMFHYLNNNLQNDNCEISIFQESCENITCIQSSNFSRDGHYSFYTEINKPYYLLLSQQSSDLNFDIDHSCSPMAINDSCVNAIQLTLTDTCIYNNYSLVSNPSSISIYEKDIFFSFTGKKNIRVKMNRENPQDMEMALYGGTCDSLFFIKKPEHSYNQFIQADGLDSNATYFIRVSDEISEYTRDIEICFESFEVISNNIVDSAMHLAVLDSCQQIDFNIHNATPSLIDNYNDVWFSFIVPNNGNINIELRRGLESIITLSHIELELYAIKDNELNILNTGTTFGSYQSQYKRIKRSMLNEQEELYVRIVINDSNELEKDFRLCISTFMDKLNDNTKTATTWTLNETCDTVQFTLSEHSSALDQQFEIDYWRLISQPNVDNINIQVLSNSDDSEMILTLYGVDSDSLIVLNTQNGFYSSSQRAETISNFDSIYIQASHFINNTYYNTNQYYICANTYVLPVNDNISGAEEIRSAPDCYALAYTNQHAKNNNLWYYFIANSNNYILSLSNLREEYVHDIRAYSGSSSELSDIYTTPYNNYNYKEILLSNLLIGDTVFIEIASNYYSRETTDYILCISEFENTSNDFCETASNISHSSNKVFQTVEITYPTISDIPSEGDNCNLYYHNQYDTWYSFSPPNNGNYSIEILSDERMALYTGTCDSLHFITCEKLYTIAGGNRMQLRDLSSDSTYYLKIMRSTWFQYDSISIAFYDWDIHPNDEIQNALLLSVGTGACTPDTFTTLYSTVDGVNFNNWGLSTENLGNVWFEFIPPPNGNILIYFDDVTDYQNDNIRSSIGYEMYGIKEDSLTNLYYSDHRLPTHNHYEGIYKGLNEFDTIFISANTDLKTHSTQASPQGYFELCIHSFSVPDFDEISTPLWIDPKLDCQLDTFSNKYAGFDQSLPNSCWPSCGYCDSDVWISTISSKSGALTIGFQPIDYSRKIIEVYQKENDSLLYNQCFRKYTYGRSFVQWQALDLNPCDSVFLRVIEYDNNTRYGRFALCLSHDLGNDYLPIISDQIIGPSTVCADGSQILYQIPNQHNVDIFEWTYGDTIISISGNSGNQISIELTAQNLANGLSVKGINECGETDLIHMPLSIASPATCALLDCIDGLSGDIDINNSILNGPNALDIYHSREILRSDAQVLNERYILFRAGEQILFEYPFQVEVGAVLEAKIEDCFNE